MSTQKVITANVQRKHGMAILWAGNVANTNMVTENLDHTVVGYHSGTHGSIIPAAQSDANMAQNEAGTDEPAIGRPHTPTYKPYSAGTYGYMAKGKYIAMKLSETISGVANTTLKFGSADFGNRKTLHGIKSIRTSYLKIWTWTGSSENGTDYTKTYSNRTPSQNDYNPDTQTSLTRALPGNLHYMYGGPDIKESAYSARTT